MIRPSLKRVSRHQAIALKQFQPRHGLEDAKHRRFLDCPAGNLPVAALARHEAELEGLDAPPERLVAETLQPFLKVLSVFEQVHRASLPALTEALQILIRKRGATWR